MMSKQFFILKCIRERLQVEVTFIWACDLYKTSKFERVTLRVINVWGKLEQNLLSQLGKSFSNFFRRKSNFISIYNRSIKLNYDLGNYQLLGAFNIGNLAIDNDYWIQCYPLYELVKPKIFSNWHFYLRNFVWVVPP